MNKKILFIVGIMVILAMLTIPVYAGPEKGQKVPIAIHWDQLSTIPGETKVTPSGIIHVTTTLVNWSVSIDVNGTLGAWNGFANNTERNVVVVPKGEEEGMMMVLREKYDLKIDGYDGGFEGSSTIVLDGVYSPNYKGKAHGLLIGYGDFEGQTLNAGHKWEPGVGEPIWEGYLLTK